MAKLAILKLNGDFETGFQVTLETGNEGERPSARQSGALPREPKMSLYLKRWHCIYRYISEVRSHVKVASKEGSRMQRIKRMQNFPLDSLKKVCKRRAEELGDRFNQWLKTEEFRPIREEWLAQLQPEDEVRAIVETDNDLLRRLPWHLWDLLTEHGYSKVEFALSAPKAKRRERRYREKVRILAILGDSRGIDVQEDRRKLEQWCGDAEIVLLKEPEREQLNRPLQKLNFLVDI